MPHSEKYEAPCAANAGRKIIGHGPDLLVRGQRIGCLSSHLGLNSAPARGLCLNIHDSHPFTPPLVRPATIARCMTSPIKRGGSAASTPAAAICP